MKSKNREMEDAGSDDSGSEGADSGDDMMSDDQFEEEEAAEEEEEEAEEGAEEDEEAGSNNKRAVEDQGGTKPKKKKKKHTDASLYKPPTMEELNTLRETQMLYHSNLFRMQMEEVLTEVQMKDSHRLQLEQWLVRFSTFLKSLPSTKECPLSNIKWLSDQPVCDPLGKLPPVKGSFVFAPPAAVEFVGSFLYGTTTKLNTTLDVMITLPRECVHAADWMNGRWVVKRVRYLSWLAAQLTDHTDLVQEMQWTYHLGNTSRPVLQVQPGGSVGKKWRVNLFVVPPPDSLKLTLFAPHRANVRPSWYYDTPQPTEEEGSSSSSPATPHYNWACAVDLVMGQHAALVQQSLTSHPSLVQGIKLLKIWLAQRQLHKGVGSFSGHMMTMLVMHLLRTRKISPQVSAYQVFRSVLVLLGGNDWCSNGPSMCASTPDLPQPAPVFHQLYEVVFVGPSGLVNLAADMMAADFHRVKYEAEQGIAMLDSSSADSFESLFIKKVEMLQFSDQLLDIQLNNVKARKALETKLPDTSSSLIMDRLGDVRMPLRSWMARVVGRGLGERVRLLGVVGGRESLAWPLGQPPPAPFYSLTMGLVLDPSCAWALLTKGPAANTEEVETFKTFWGAKSSLRRFQDGSFHEAVLWHSTKSSAAQRRLIPRKICQYLLNSHFDMWSKHILFVADQLERVLCLPKYRMLYEYSTGEEYTVSAIQALDSLSKKLRNLDLPLKITAIQPTSEVSRHTRVFPPTARSLQTKASMLKAVDGHVEFTGKDGPSRMFNYSMEVIVFLEISGKWPDDVVAIQAIKAEFHSKMSELLREEGVTTLLFPTHLQILWEGYFFHVKVSYLREIYLRRLVQTPEGDWKEKETPEALQLEKQIEILPRFTTALASIQADHPSFSGGVRLCKRWASSQLLVPHLPPTALELLVAWLYLNPAPYAPPHTPHVALLRFLHLVAHTDWQTTPFLVNLNQAFTVEDVAELSRRFTSNRVLLPPLFLATPYELRSPGSSGTPEDLDQRYKLASTWTKAGPSQLLLYRAKQLAQAALTYLTANLLTKDVDAMTIFRPSYEDYDVTIWLEGRQLGRREEQLDWTASHKDLDINPYTHTTHQLMPVVMFDIPQLYLQELRETYDHLALFFYDEHGGSTIGVVWKPQTTTTQEPKVGNMEGHKWVGVKEVKQVANLEAVLADFHTLGAGLVRKVSVRNK